MKISRYLVLLLLLTPIAALAVAGCAANPAAASLTPSLDGRYLVQSGGGRVVLWARQGRNWRLLWRRVAAVNSLAIPVGNGGDPAVVLAAGRALRVFDRAGERWSADGPPGMAVRRLAAADLNGDSLDEAVALYGPPLGGAEQTLIVFDMTGREAARRGGADRAVLAAAAGEFDGAKRQELAIAERGPDGVIRLSLFALAPEGLLALGGTVQLPRGLRALAAADLDEDGEAELIAAFARPGRTELQTYRWQDEGLKPVGQPLQVDGSGDLLPAGRKMVALRFRNGRRWSYAVVGWAKGGPTVQTRLDRFRAGAFLVPAEDGALELLAAGSRGPQSLLQVE